MKRFISCVMDWCGCEMHDLSLRNSDAQSNSSRSYTENSEMEAGLKLSSYISICPITM